MECSFKASIIGVGKVGATAAYALIMDGTVTDLVLVGHDKQKVEGEKIDLEHALPFLQSTNIVATDDYNDISGSDLVIVTAGVAQEPGESRLSLLQRNLKIFDDIIPKIKAANPDGEVLIVANPVDILTYHTYQIAQWRDGQVFGSGTLLDTARFRFHLSQLFNVNARSIHAYILGEHGDSSFPLLSRASVGGQPLTAFPTYSAEKVTEAFTSSRNAAARIIAAKGATYYAIGAVIMSIVKSMYSDAKSVLPLSVPLKDYLGQSDVSLSVPCIIGRSGIQRVLNVEMSEQEQQQFTHSAETLRQAYAEATHQS